MMNALAGATEPDAGSLREADQSAAMICHVVAKSGTYAKTRPPNPGGPTAVGGGGNKMCKSASEPLLDCGVYGHIGNGFIRCHVEQKTFVPCKG
jgi:hypothetical protein